MLKSESAQTNPIEVLFTVMLAFIGMAFLLLTVGPFVDGFMDSINKMNMPLSTWGQGMMNNLVIRYVSWVYVVPGFFCMLMIVWGIKTVIKKHEYSTQQQDQFMQEEL